MKADIQTISADATWPVRQHVFWPDQPISQAMLQNDHEGRHFGAFVNGRLVAVASLFPEGKTARLRKLATLEDYQNLGIGSTLLEFIIQHARQQGFESLWCSVLEQALPYYRNFGFELEPQSRKYKGTQAYCRIVLAL